MKFKAVVFDLDGTLLDTIDDLADSMNSVLEQNGYPVHDIEAYKYFVGDGLRNLVSKALPADKRNDETINRGLAAMRSEYSKRWADKTKPYPGITNMLDALVENGIKLSVLSNKADDFVKAIMKRFFADWVFEPMLGERKGTPRKPDPAGALEIARILDIKPCEFLYLGDTGVDMITANAAGMYAVGALWGFRKAGELRENGAMVLAADPAEIPKLL